MKSLLMLISVFALVISLVSAQASATQCNDGIDNDEDGKTDALAVNTQTQTPRITQDVSQMRTAFNAAHTNHAFWGSGTSLNPSDTTRNHYCQLIGYDQSTAHTTQSWSSPDDNYRIRWENGQWLSSNNENPYVSSITCQRSVALADCSDRQDNDGDTLIDAADPGCDSLQDDSELQHDDGCASPSDNDETPRNECVDSSFAWEAAIQQNPCCGDDESDYSFSSGNKLCIKNTQDQWQWITGATGLVVTGLQGDRQHDFMYDGTQWKWCTGVSTAAVDATTRVEAITESIYWTATIITPNNKWKKFTTRQTCCVPNLATLTAANSALIDNTANLLPTGNYLENTYYGKMHGFKTFMFSESAQELSLRITYKDNLAVALNREPAAAPSSTFISEGLGLFEATQAITLHLNQGWNLLELLVDQNDPTQNSGARHLSSSSKLQLETQIQNIHAGQNCNSPQDMIARGSIPLLFNPNQYSEKRDITSQITLSDCLREELRSGNLRITTQGDNNIRICQEQGSIKACLDTTNNGQCDVDEPVWVVPPLPVSTGSGTQSVAVGLKPTADGHEYFCYQDTNYRFAECCGSESCNSERATNTYEEGQTETFSNTLYECSHTAQWSTDINFDDNPAACTEAGYQWASNFCCGDGTTGDDGRLSPDNKFLCVHETTGNVQAWRLYDAAQANQLGRIHSPGRKDYLSKGDAWLKCENSAFYSGTARQGNVQMITRTAANSQTTSHQDICIGKQVFECAGDETGNGFIKVPARAKTTGQIQTDNSNPENPITYYCTSRNFFTTNLDTAPGEVPNSIFAKTCASASPPLHWTGRYCCSEAEDTDETYNDEGGQGICYNTEFKGNSELLESSKILVVNGVAQGCQATGALAALQNLPNPAHAGTQGILIHPNDLCLMKTVGADNYYCGPTGWQTTQETSLIQRSTPGASTPPALLQQGCCPANKCYNPAGNDGTPACVDSGSETDDDQVHFICSDGNWQATQEKFNWNNERGCCSQDSQYLVNPNPSSENAAATLNDLETLDIDDASANDIRCINSGQYIGDHYCEDGKWTTRTKLIALTLRNSPEIRDKYTLYCDTYDKVVNRFSDTLPETNQFDAQEIFTGSGSQKRLANNICVLVLDGMTAFGTSLNQPFAQSQTRGNAQVNIWDLVNEDQGICGAASGNSMQSCRSNHLWYNPQLNLVIYSKEGIRITSVSNEGFPGQTLAFLSNPISTMRELFIGALRQSDTLAVNEFLSQTKNFDTLYLAKNGEREVKAFIEEGLGANHDQNHFSALFSCFNEDVCTSIDSEYPSTISNDVRCSHQGTSSAVQFSRGRSQSSDVWTSLTSSLRLNADTADACR